MLSLYEMQQAKTDREFRGVHKFCRHCAVGGDEIARRRYYAITELGRETYHQNRADWEKQKPWLINW